MMRTLLVLLICSASTSFAQLRNLSVHASANYALIPSVSQEKRMTLPPVNTGYWNQPVNAGTLKQSFESKPGFDIGGSFDLGLTERWFIRTGLSISHVRFKRSITIENLSPTTFSWTATFPNSITTGYPMGGMYGSFRFEDLNNPQASGSPSLLTSPDVGRTTLTFLQLPVLAGTSFLKQRLVVLSGVTFSHLVRSTRYIQQYSAEDRSIFVSKDKSEEGLNSFTTGITLATCYKITKNIGVDLTAIKGISSLDEGATKETGKAKLNTISLGLRYSFLK